MTWASRERGIVEAWALNVGIIFYSLAMAS